MPNTIGEEYVIQRNGKDYAILVSVQEWRRRTLAKRLDAHRTRPPGLPARNKLEWKRCRLQENRRRKPDRGRRARTEGAASQM